MSEFITPYMYNLTNSVMLTVVFLGLYLLCKFFITRRTKTKKARAKYLTRLKYGFVILFLICFIKIWEKGFEDILALVGFVLAAFTLTQKENLLNIVGWLIINWRGLFSEGDHIRISNYSGCVKSIGVLYFNLIEGSPDFPDSLTGRIIKIPNGMVSRNPIVNFSQEKYVECTLNLVFKPKCEMKSFDLLFSTLKSHLQHYVNEDQDYSPRYLLKIRQEKPAGYEMLFSYHCPYQDKAVIQHELNEAIIQFTSRHPDLVLAFD